ncbi:Uncharacterized protein HZ326_19431 [Fusarium oxysporum f. sp. albedinis]|nr:Uncharacterized protein HZ326_19431 [Fusarium oxysporum f. sp. albedinis]
MHPVLIRLKAFHWCICIKRMAVRDAQMDYLYGDYNSLYLLRLLRTIQRHHSDAIFSVIQELLATIKYLDLFFLTSVLTGG